MSCAFGAAPITCDITQVGASASNSGNGHGYDYILTGDSCQYAAGAHVIAGYDVNTKEAKEKADYNGALLSAVWTCSSDPWIFPSGQTPQCVRISSNVSGDTAQINMSDYINATVPVSAGVLTDISRQALNGQLQNAIKAAARPPATSTTPNPVPTPTPTNQRCSGSACQVLPETQPTSTSLAAPTDVSGTLTATRTRIVLAWGPVSGATSYELVGTNADSGLFYRKTLSADSSAYADDIGANQTGDFVYQLKACNATGCSASVGVVVSLSALPCPGAVMPKSGPYLLAVVNDVSDQASWMVSFS
jgi:hypothetical protein